MLVQVAYVETPDKREAVLRSSPEGIQDAVEHAKGRVLFKLEREVYSAGEEFLLWLEFVAEADKYGKMDVAEAKCQIFYRKGKSLWTTFKDIPNLALFTAWTDDMYVQVSKKTFQ